MIGEKPNKRKPLWHDERMHNRTSSSWPHSFNSSYEKLVLSTARRKSSSGCSWGSQNFPSATSPLSVSLLDCLSTLLLSWKVFAIKIMIKLGNIEYTSIRMRKLILILVYSSVCLVVMLIRVQWPCQDWPSPPQYYRVSTSVYSTKLSSHAKSSVCRGFVSRICHCYFIP